LATDAYDANGNTTASGVNIGTNGYVYDFENRLIQQGGIIIVYDGDGNRVSKTVAGITTSYFSRALGFSWTPNCDENESEITRRCV